MATFADFEEVYEPLTLTIGGKQYKLPPVVAAEGVKFTAAATGVEGAAPFTDEMLRAMLLGPTYQTMLDDQVPEPAIQRVLLTALADFQAGRSAAEMMWVTGGDPKAIEGYVKARTPNRASRRSKRTAAVTKTP